MTDYEWGRDIRQQDPWPMEGQEFIGHETYRGTIHLDHDITTFTPFLHDVIGLDRERWSIVGFNISPNSGKYLVNGRGGSDLIRVYAVDRELLSDEEKAPGAFHSRKGDLEVVEFLCHDLTFEDLLKCFKQVNIHLKTKGLDSLNFMVTGRADIPVQDD